jgi:hypothetical protein
MTPLLSVDHLLWAVPDLAAGIDHFEQLTGVRAARGGSHPGRGTANALCSFGNGRYLELIGPDPAQDIDALPDSLAAGIRALPSAGLYTFAVACADLEAQAGRAAQLGLAFQGPVASSRRTPEGSLLRWRLGHTQGSAFGRQLPFYIDWQDAPHPSATVPGGLRLLSLEMVHPQADALAALYAGLGVPVPVRPGDSAGLRAVVAGPTGEVLLDGARTPG